MEINNENMISHKYFPENKHEYTYISSFIVFNNKRLRENNFIERIYYAKIWKRIYFKI